MSNDTVMWVFILLVGPAVGLAVALLLLRGRPERREKFQYMLAGALIFEAYQYLTAAVVQHLS